MNEAHLSALALALDAEILGKLVERGIEALLALANSCRRLARRRSPRFVSGRHREQKCLGRPRNILSALMSNNKSGAGKGVRARARQGKASVRMLRLPLSLLRSAGVIDVDPAATRHQPRRGGCRVCISVTLYTLYVEPRCRAVELYSYSTALYSAV